MVLNLIQSDESDTVEIRPSLFHLLEIGPRIIMLLQDIRTDIGPTRNVFDEPVLF